MKAVVLAWALCVLPASAALADEARRDAQQNPCPDELPARPLALLDVVNGALCHNPQTRIGWANRLAQEAQVSVLRAPYFPTVTATASLSRNNPVAGASTNQRGIGLSLSYLLYDFGARAANLENAQQLLKALQATENSVVQTVFLAAVQAFYQVQATKAVAEAAASAEKAAQTSLSAAEARYQAGTVTLADQLTARTAWSQAKLNRITAEGNHRSAQGALANALGQDAQRPLALVADSDLSAKNLQDFQQDVNALVAQARAHRPDLQAAEAQYQAARASVDAARAAAWPTLNFTASNNWQGVNGAALGQSSTLGLTLSVPLFSGLAPTYRIQAAEAQANSKQATLQQLHLQVALEVWNAYQAVLTNTQTLRAAQDVLQSATQAEAVASGRYQAGVGILLDVLNAQSTLASARQQLIQARFNWNIARASLAQSVGQLDVSVLQDVKQ